MRELTADNAPGYLHERGWVGTGPVGVELLALVGFLFIPPVASLLDHAPPSLAGFAVALLAAPAVIAADAAHKAWRARRRVAA